MKAEEVVIQLIKTIPRLTDAFTAKQALTSLTSVGLLATGVTALPHQMNTGDVVVVVGSDTAINLAEFTRLEVGFKSVGTLVTVSDHDLTLGHQEHVILDHGDVPAYNQPFKILSVPNRKTVTFDVSDVPNTTALPTALPQLMNGESFGYNGAYPVTIIDEVTFTYPLAKEVVSPAFGSPFAHTSFRISAGITKDRVLAAYTQQEVANLWLFVVLDNVTASKDRNLSNDLVYFSTGGQHYQQQVSQPFSLLIVQPAKNDVAARTQRDTIEELIQPIFQAVLGVRFNTGFFSRNQYKVTFLRHGVYDYNTAIYSHEVSFECLADIFIEDGWQGEPTVAFRDIDLTMYPSFDKQTSQEKLTSDIDLDVNPLSS